MTQHHVKHLIIGGGIIGCSTAYHLAKNGGTDIVLLEKASLTEGATWHAAGLVGQLRSSRNTTRMLKRSVAMYDALEAETGMAFDWKKVGSLRLAATKERLLEAQRSDLFPVKRHASFRLKRIVHRHGPFEHPRGVARGPQLPDQPRRMPGRPFGQGRLFQQDDIGLAVLGQMIGGGTSDDAAADDKMFYVVLCHCGSAK